MSKAQMITSHSILALDVGGVRIGVAIAGNIARLPHPLTVIENNQQVWDKLKEICVAENVKTIVVGLPRGLGGQETEQTEISRAFAKELETKIGAQVYLQDEALTSVRAEAELTKKGKSFDKQAVDSLAATYVLEDFLSSKNGAA